MTTLKFKKDENGRVTCTKKSLESAVKNQTAVDVQLLTADGKPRANVQLKDVTSRAAGKATVYAGTAPNGEIIEITIKNGVAHTYIVTSEGVTNTGNADDALAGQVKTTGETDDNEETEIENPKPNEDPGEDEETEEEDTDLSEEQPGGEADEQKDTNQARTEAEVM